MPRKTQITSTSMKLNKSREILVKFYYMAFSPTFILSALYCSLVVASVFSTNRELERRDRLQKEAGGGGEGVQHKRDTFIYQFLAS